MASFSSFERGNPEYTTGRKKYPNPFFDLASWNLPKNIKTLFKYCRGFFYTNGFIRNIISKLTEYPITDLIYEGDHSPEVLDSYKSILNNNVKIKELLMSVGLDYYTYGNCFVSTNLSFKRFLRCTHCSETTPVEKVQYRWKELNFEGECPKCNQTNAPFAVEDVELTHAGALNFVRWAPENIDIEFDEISGQTTYYYNISAKRKKQILGGVKHVVEKTPELFLQALRDKKLITLDKNNLYHFKRPTLAEEDRGWGKPIILPAIKDIYYMQTLKRGNEAISLEHIVPKKAIFPQAGGAVDPYTQMNLGKWQGKMEDTLKKWKADPNHIGVFPIPIGYQELGGDAKSLLISNELKFIEENVINSVGLPLEFIKGGTSWTGSSISLRMVENHFLPYREMLAEFMNYFVLGKISQFLDYPEIKVRFKKLRMTDDSESKQILFNLNTNKKVSDETMLSEMGFDFDEEKQRLSEDQDYALEFNTKNMEIQSEAQGKGQVILAKYQALSQTALQNEMHRQREVLFSEEIATENKTTHIDSSEIIDKLAIQLSLMPEQQRQVALNDLAQRAPVTAGFVLERFLAKQPQETPEPPKGDGGGGEDNVKEKNKVKAGPDKKKGPTRGQAK